MRAIELQHKCLTLKAEHVVEGVGFVVPVKDFEMGKWEYPGSFNVYPPIAGWGTFFVTVPEIDKQERCIGMLYSDLHGHTIRVRL